MENKIYCLVKMLKADRVRRQRFTAVMIVLSMIVSSTVFWQLHSTGNALTDEFLCGMSEHKHTVECLSQELKCSDESEDHEHTSQCYETVFSCGERSHLHTVQCRSDISADIETEEDWEATLPEETADDLCENIVAVAESQLGYTESTKNFIIADDGVTRRGYTRYGEWYGNRYGDWNTLFAYFCLYYAEVTEKELPYGSGCWAWTEELKKAELFNSPEDITVKIGDLVFFDTDSDEKADRVGIVSEIMEDEEDGITITAIEGDLDGKVDKAEYSMEDEKLVGFVSMDKLAESVTLSPEDAETADIEDVTDDTVNKPEDSTEEEPSESETLPSEDAETPTIEDVTDGMADTPEQSTENEELSESELPMLPFGAPNIVAYANNGTPDMIINGSSNNTLNDNRLVVTEGEKITIEIKLYNDKNAHPSAYFEEVDKTTYDEAKSWLRFENNGKYYTSPANIWPSDNLANVNAEYVPNSDGTFTFKKVFTAAAPESGQSQREYTITYNSCDAGSNENLYVRSTKSYFNIISPTSEPNTSSASNPYIVKSGTPVTVEIRLVEASTRGGAGYTVLNDEEYNNQSFGGAAWQYFEVDGKKFFTAANSWGINSPDTTTGRKFSFDSTTNELICSETFTLNLEADKTERSVTYTFKDDVNKNLYLKVVPDTSTPTPDHQPPEIKMYSCRFCCICLIPSGSSHHVLYNSSFHNRSELSKIHNPVSPVCSPYIYIRTDMQISLA